MKTLILNRAAAIARFLEAKQVEILFSRFRIFARSAESGMNKMLSSGKKMRYGENLWKF